LSDFDHEGDHDIFYKSKENGASWPTSNEIVSMESDQASGSPSLDVDDYRNTVHIAWHEGCGHGIQILAKSKINNEIWPPFVEVVSSECTEISSHPSIACGIFFSVHVAWQDNFPYNTSGYDYDILYKNKQGFCFYSRGPGIIMAFGSGTIDTSTGIFDLSPNSDNKMYLYFAGFTGMGGGPSIMHTAKTFSNIKGAYHTTNSINHRTTATGERITGWLSAGDYVVGYSYG
jgi:hypothetical protein